LGGISTACARFIGLIILNLDLRKFQLWRWEIYLAWSWLVVAGGECIPIQHACLTDTCKVSWLQHVL
jgi:hypothetical protein